MSTSPNPVAVSAVFSRATTLCDGGWRLSFDISEHQGAIAAQIAALKGENLFLVVFTEDQYAKANKHG
jgi:hypothetical protein